MKSTVQRLSEKVDEKPFRKSFFNDLKIQTVIYFDRIFSNSPTATKAHLQLLIESERHLGFSTVFARIYAIAKASFQIQIPAEDILL